MRVGSKDGSYELEHGSRTKATTLLGYPIGSAARTPIVIGTDDQNVTGLVVAGRSGQSRDLQQWTASGAPIAAIDGRGRLRLQDAPLGIVQSGGVTRLVVRFANGTERVLALSR